MANIHGIKILKYEVSSDDEYGSVYFGEFCLDGKKIATGTNVHTGAFTLEMEESYSREHFLFELSVLHGQHLKIGASAMPVMTNYTPEDLFWDYLDLKEYENHYMHALSMGNLEGIMVVKNEHTSKISYLSSNMKGKNDDEIISESKDLIDMFKDEYQAKYGSRECDVKIFRSFPDFIVGERLDLKKITIK